MVKREFHSVVNNILQNEHSLVESLYLVMHVYNIIYLVQFGTLHAIIINNIMIIWSGTPANLEIELSEITQPYQFGLHLGMTPSALQLIERNHPGDVARQRTEVITYWSRNNECTWEKVADAVKRLGCYGNLEKKLRQMHTRGMHSSLAISIIQQH